MKSIIRFTLVLVLPLYFHVICAQPIDNAIGDVTVASPNVAAMNKYIDIPVSTFTGIPSIDIPIYTIQEGPISVPISLSYHAGGIKLGETASWVGLGWNLSAGGMVSRSVIGSADEGVTGYISELYTTSSDQQIGEGLIDAEPDAFSFSFGGYSGKMIWAHTENNGQGGFYIYPKSDLKVITEVNDNTHKIDYFIFKTPTGLQYTFGNGNIEETKFSTSAAEPPGDAVTTSWLLTEISTPKGKSKNKVLRK